MKKLMYVAVAVLGVLILAYLFSLYKIKTVCFGDVCPQNGGTYLLYKKAYTEEECMSIGGSPIIGMGWVRVYAGCSPDNVLTKFVAEIFN